MLDSIGDFFTSLADQIAAFPGAILRDLKTLDLQGLSETLFSTTGLVVGLIVVVLYMLLRPSNRL